MFSVEIGDMSSEGLTVEGVAVMTREQAVEGIKAADRAIRLVSRERARAGRKIEGLAEEAEYLSVSAEFFTKAGDTLASADIAEEYTQNVRLMLLSKASGFILDQASRSAQNIMNLLQ